MTREEIIRKAESFGAWYHRIKLAEDYWTPSNMEPSWPIWEMIRRARKGIDYSGKAVLDVGTMDGMWAFEAEQLGASRVWGADIWQAQPQGRERAIFAAQAIGSEIGIMEANVEGLSGIFPFDLFDIIQCFGVLYHVENPLLALRQMRFCINENGLMILETAVWKSEVRDPSVRLNTDNGVYHDSTTFWVPNEVALDDMLKLTGWAIDDKAGIERCYKPESSTSYRICMVCRPS